MVYAYYRSFPHELPAAVEDRRSLHWILPRAETGKQYGYNNHSFDYFGGPYIRLTKVKTASQNAPLFDMLNNYEIYDSYHNPYSPSENKRVGPWHLGGTNAGFFDGHARSYKTLPTRPTSVTFIEPWKVQ